MAAEVEVDEVSDVVVGAGGIEDVTATLGMLVKASMVVQKIIEEAKAKTAAASSKKSKRKEATKYRLFYF